MECVLFIKKVGEIYIIRYIMISLKKKYIMIKSNIIQIKGCCFRKQLGMGSTKITAGTN